MIRAIFSSLNDIEEWRLGDSKLAAAKGYPREYAAELIDDYGILFLDFTLDAANGMPVCHEVNGPNGAGSDALTGDSILRAENEARQAARRARELGLLHAEGTPKTQVVTIHAHQHWKFFRTGSEFYPRVEQFGRVLNESLPGLDMCIRSATEPLGHEQVAIIVGDVPAVAANLTVNSRTGRFEYSGRPVIFIGNTNLIPEMIRTGKLRRDGDRIPGADLRIFHGWRLAHAVNDKALQQRLFQGTGVRPLRHFEAHSLGEALLRTKEMLLLGPVVLKPNYGSGGAGVRAIAPGMTDQAIEATLEAVVNDCRMKYGENVEAVMYPIRGFEFVRSTDFVQPDGGHLWDLRIAALFEPGKVRVFPGSLRFAPQAFDETSFHLGRDQWVSNVSGRQITLHRSGLDDEMLAGVGMSGEILERAMKACASWTLKAWDRAMRGGGGKAAVYEDECEENDKSFYPWDRFSI
jgi:hypothetical protein